VRSGPWVAGGASCGRWRGGGVGFAVRSESAFRPDRHRSRAHPHALPFTLPERLERPAVVKKAIPRTDQHRGRLSLDGPRKHCRWPPSSASSPMKRHHCSSCPRPRPPDAGGQLSVRGKTWACPHDLLPRPLQVLLYEPRRVPAISHTSSHGARGLAATVTFEICCACRPVTTES
jgi:hypothetical protein